MLKQRKSQKKFENRELKIEKIRKDYEKYKLQLEAEKRLPDSKET